MSGYNVQVDPGQKGQKPPWLWWKHGVIYHIYPRSFYDSNGDGIGDLHGIIRKLDYLKDLGIDAIWLSPIYCSPNFDYGYDVTDYRGINPEYGTMEDFKQLLKATHKNGIRVIMDMILNHTSDQHPWFLESCSSRNSLKRDWYIWKEGLDGKPPNNWKSAIGGSAWTYDRNTGEYYLHSFFSEQPDLNWHNQEMANAMFDEMKFWLDIGVDGFRLDVINMIIKDKRFRNNPFYLGIPLFQKHIYTRNRLKSIKIVRKLRGLLDQYPECIAVGEIYTPPPGNPDEVVNYLSGGDRGIHLAFDFSLIFTRWNAHHHYQKISAWYSKIPDKGWPCNVLSNHDLFRSINRNPFRLHQTEKAKIAAFLLLTMKGTPFIYYGEEIGMKNGRLRKKQIRDALGKKFWPFFPGRDKARTPMQWSPDPHAGFTTGNPWLPVNADYQWNNVENQDQSPDSLLKIYKSLILLRKQYVALQDGTWTPIRKGENGVLIYLRKSDLESLMVILNFTGYKKRIRLKKKLKGDVLLSTSRMEGAIFLIEHLIVSPYEATLINLR